MSDSSIKILREISLTNDWFILLPELVLALIAFLILGIDLFTNSSNKRGKFPNAREWITPISLIGQCLVLFSLIFFGDYFFNPNAVLFSGLIEQSESTQYMRYFFIFSSLGVTFLAAQFFNNKKIPKPEYFHIVLIASAGFMLLIQSAHFIAFFVNLELVTIAFYVLVGFERTNSLSLEASLKYLILGGLSSAILLFGIVLLYGIAGNPEMNSFTQDGFSFSALESFITLNAGNPIVCLGALLVIAGIAFKVGLVPFQIWVPDVYQGAPLPTTAFLAIASKSAGIFVLLQLIQGPFIALVDFLIPILSVLCAVTILYGNIAACGQVAIKKLIGLSGISHAGYLLLGIISISFVPEAINALLFYISVYMLSSFLVFGSSIFMDTKEDSFLEIKDFQGLIKNNPLLGVAGLIGLGSLAGVPPLGGFIAKTLILIAAFQANLYSLIVFALLGIVISIYYYFSWIRSILFIQKNDSIILNYSSSVSLAQRFFLWFLILSVLLIGVFPKLLTQFI